MTTTRNSDSNKKSDSFLNEFQLEGKSSGKISLENWEEALGSVNRILNDETLKAYHKVDWNKLKPVPMAIYCHDCDKIAPPDLKTFGRKTREVCGSCGSKKISKGREEALRKYYKLEKPEVDSNIDPNLKANLKSEN